MTQVNVRYRASGKYSRSDATIIQNEFNRLFKKNGSVTPKSVVVAARPARSKLHRFFEWDDKKAADAYRLEQAHRMIISIRVVFQDDKDGGELRAWSPISTDVKGNDKGESYSYEPTTNLLTDQNRAAALVAAALQDLKAWKFKYSALLASQSGLKKQLVKAVDALESALRKKAA